MKNLAMATLAALGLMATTATANELTFGGSTEYAIEAEVFTVDAGVAYAFDQFYVASVVTGDNSGPDFDFVGAELEFGFEASSSTTLYVRVEADGDFDYTETIVGAKFTF